MSIVVAGTNGKGSCVAWLESLLQAAGKTTAAYTSPHLRRYTERLRINREEMTEAAWCEAFTAVEAALGEETLTYFEYGTLAALWLSARAGVDYQILEVGLGGRLDAVNIIDADVSVISSIGLDHQAWLGDTREAIALEKAGIMRPGRPAICGDAAPPASLLTHAQEVDAQLLRIGDDFSVTDDGQGGWCFQSANLVLDNLVEPRAVHQRSNAACALAALEAIGALNGTNPAQVRAALSATTLPARFEVVPGDVTHIFDVAHNGDAAGRLAEQLAQWRDAQAGQGEGLCIHAVFSSLADKPVAEMCRKLAQRIDAWYVGGLEAVSRGMSADALSGLMPKDLPFQAFKTVGDAWRAAVRAAGKGDAIVVFGSFYTVAEVLEELHDR